MTPYRPIEARAAELIDSFAGKLEALTEWLEDLSQRIVGEQCPHFLVFGSDKYVGRVLCQKRKGHRGKHRTAEWEDFDNG